MKKSFETVAIALLLFSFTPAAYASDFISISNVTHTPLTPAFIDNVTVSADITPINATNISATVWYRLGTSGTFTAITLTNTEGNIYTTTPPLPRTAPGTVQYYIETTFTSPQGGDPYTVTAPTAGPLAPLAFTNSEALAAYTEVLATEGWTLSPGSSSQTNNDGWILNNGFAKNRRFTVPVPLQAVWLSAYQPDSTYLQTPRLPFGVGVIHMENALNVGGSAKLDILVSTNGIDNWLPSQTVDIANGTNWTWSVIPLNITTSLYLRFVYHDVYSQNIGFDNISITHPLATVAISNVAFHPYYPAATEPVHITCGISSTTEFSPAFDITARVYYKVPTDTGWSGPLEMTGNGNSFITRSPIPPYPSDTTVNYYIESTFKGYSSFYSYSPTLSPDNTNTAPYSYTTRTYSSSYNTLNFGIGGATGGMSRVSDNQWEGLMQFGSPTNHPEFLILGYGYYDGTNIGGGLSTTWGDDSTTRTNLPLAGVAEADGIPITIPEMAQGQYLVIFNEISRQYAVQRAAFQNFDIWPASDTIFEESYAAAVIKQYLQDFDGWNPSDPNPMTDVFEAGWTNIVSYPYGGTYPEETAALSPASAFMLYDGVVVTQLVGSAAMLIQTPSNGEIRSTEPTSIGAISFDARCASPSDFRPTIYDQLTESNVMITATIKATDLPINSSSNSLGYAHKSILANYVDPNNYYELRMRQRNTTQKSLELWKNSAGALTLRSSYGITGSITTNDTFSLLLFRAGSTINLRAYFSNFSTAYAGFNDTAPLPPSTHIGLNSMDVSLAVDSVAVYGVTNTSYDVSANLYTEDFSSGTASNWTTGGGVWTVTNNTFCRPGYTGPMLSLNVDYSQDLMHWTSTATFTNVNHSYYKRYTATPHQAASAYVRIRHKNGEGNIVIDNIRSEAWRGETLSSNSWVATNAWVTCGKNSNGIELRGSRALPGDAQFIQTPVISNGIAVISFDYKSVTSGGDPLIFALEYTRTNAPAMWLTYLEFTNTPTIWENFSHTINRELRPQIQQMRIRNASTNAAVGILLDNIFITEAVPLDDFGWWGYNVLVTDKQDSKLATNLTGNIKGAYLNSSPAYGTGSNLAGVAIAYTSYYPSIQSARLPDGVGEISFWYRAWDGNPTTIEIVTATNRLQPDAEWITLDTVPVTNRVFTLYRRPFYDSENRYIKLRIDTASGSPGRAAIDNLRILAPFASNLRMKNLKLIPKIPLFTDDVFVQIEVDDLFLSPSNIALRLYVKQGTSDWGQYATSDVDLKPVSSNGSTVIFQTITPISARAIDTVIQYQVEATFDGFFTEGHTSPKRYSGFENPDHYWPVDLNREQPYPTPYYYTLSCLPGQVWINEFNVADGGFGVPGPQYIEIVGKGNTRIGNWRVEVINPTTYTTNDAYTIPSDTVLGTISNSYGFYVLGDNTVTHRRTTLTNTLPDSAGIQLVRSMGAFEFQVSYDRDSASPRLGEDMALSADHRFVYAGMDDDAYAAALTLIGTGSNSTDFVWWAPTEGDSARTFSISTTNVGQTLIPWPDSSPDQENDPYTGTVKILNAWHVDTQIVMEVATQSTNLTPKIWYSTNLINIAWAEVPSPVWSRTGTTYNVSFTTITNAHQAFYTITVTDTD